MTTGESFEQMLTGGHPNSLGRTVEVVEIVLADPAQLERLYRCYFSADEVVRLRTSNAFKRICRTQPAWLVPYVDRFLSEVAQIDQPSAQWTLAQLLLELDSFLTSSQRKQAIAVLKRNLLASNDWIVLNMTMQTLGHWARHDADLLAWLRPALERLSGDPRKSVAKTAEKVLKGLLKTR
jgi:hypothetical protein